MEHDKMPRLVVVADDLTGAADSSARCVHAGLSAEIWLDATPGPVEVDVVAVSTDSRFLPPEDASRRVRDTMASLTTRFGEASVSWYKKIDSTLRGNLGAELDAMLDALSVSAAVICPAFPKQGRGLVQGKLVHSGTAAHDLPLILRGQSHAPVGVVELETVRQGADALERALQERLAQGEKLIVVDGLDDSDLENIVAATQGTGSQAQGLLLCGSAGMVAPLAARIAMQKDVQVNSPMPVAPGPILAVVGSGNATSHAQVAHVAATESMRVRAVDKSWHEVDLVGTDSHPVGDWLICLAPPADEVELEGAVARAQAARLADLSYAAVDRLQPSALMVVGGDTAHYVLGRLGFERLTVVEELLPGIPLAIGVDRNGGQRAVVLKPGNFGDGQTLVTLQEALQARQA